VLVELGVWWGQNLVLLENLRAIHEPFNKQRIVVGFDTFSGYRTFTDKDIRGDVMSDGTYATPPGYRDYLASLLEAHEGANAFGHQRGNHRLVEGDATQTVPKYFADHPETLVAMAFFDIGTYLPTVEALKAMKSSLMPGSVLVFDELTWPGAPGEAIQQGLGVRAEILHGGEHPGAAGDPTHAACGRVVNGAAQKTADIGVDFGGVFVARGWRDSGQQIGAPGTCRTVVDPRRGGIDSNCGTDYLSWPA
jgi:hypothetical protein